MNLIIKLPCDEKEFIKIIESSKTIGEVIRRIGLSHSGNSYGQIERQIYLLGIKADHLLNRKRKPKNYMPEDLANAAKESKSLLDMLRILKFGKHQGRVVRADVVRYGIDISHFSRRKHLDKNKQWDYVHIPLDKILNNEIYIKAEAVRKKLIENGVKKEICEHCGKNEHAGQPISLEL